METVFESRRGWPMMTQFTWFVWKQQALGGTDDLHRCGLVRLRVVAGSRVLCLYDLLLVWPSQEFPFSLTPSSIYLIQVMMHISFMVLGMKPSLACNAGQGLYNELHPTRILKFTYVRDFFVSVLMFSFLRCLPVHSSFLKLACPQFPESSLFLSVLSPGFCGCPCQAFWNTSPFQTIFACVLSWLLQFVLVPPSWLSFSAADSEQHFFPHHCLEPTWCFWVASCQTPVYCWPRCPRHVPSSILWLPTAGPGILRAFLPTLFPPVSST